uniref:G_PROTEIN_RECEP_F1_2 domain-containing protein n=1 Tax=Steinernema glaseri TaxID=37863 RepID=A0A1I8ACB9_9BILA
MVAQNVETLIYVVEGLLIVAVNLPVALVIFFSSKFKNAREFTFVGGLCLADVVYGLAFFTAGAVRTHAYGSAEAIDCHWLPWMLLSLVGYQSTALMTLLVSLDRLVAAYFPTWHLNVMTQRKKTVILLAVFFLILCTAPLAWFVESSSAEGVRMLTAECYVSRGLITQLWSYVLGFRIVTILISCVVCIPVARKIRSLAAKNIATQRSKLSKHRKLVHLTATIALSTSISLVLLVVPDVVFLFNVGNVAADYHVLFYALSLSNCVVNAVLFTARHRELRRALVVAIFACLGAADTKVSSGKRVLFSTSLDLPTNSVSKVSSHRLAPYESKARYPKPSIYSLEVETVKKLLQTNIEKLTLNRSDQFYWKCVAASVLSEEF